MLDVVKEKDQSRGNYQLRRRGLVVSFGYEGDRYKIPEDDMVKEIIHGPYYGDENKGYFTKFLAGLEKAKGKAQCQGGVELLIQALKDIKAAHFYKDDSWDCANVEFKTKIPLNSPLNIQACEDLQEDEDQYGDTPYIESIQCDNIEVELDYSDVKLKFKDKGDEKFYLTEKLNLVDFIRISEPDIYNTITKLIDDLQVQVEKKVATKARRYQEILDKYGQYLVYKEL
jgi:hypothetical protein